MSACSAAGALRGYGVNLATCSSQGIEFDCTPPVAHAAHAAQLPLAPACRRNIYLDLGANWCNTLRLYESLPEVTKEGLANAAPWHVFAVEAAPLISPYVEKCVAAVAAGKPLPMPPVPPAGSSMQLLNYAEDLGCASAGRGRRERMNCIGKALEQPLQKLVATADPRLTANPALLRARLGGARSRGGCSAHGAVEAATGSERTTGVASVGGGSYELIPAAAGGSTGVLHMAGSPLQMLRGGSMVAGSNHMPRFDVPKVDVVQWMLDSFTVEDFVVLKMDVEGAELEIVPKVCATTCSPRRFAPRVAARVCTGEMRQLRASGVPSRA
jgi:hypothetical protein